MRSACFDHWNEPASFFPRLELICFIILFCRQPMWHSGTLKITSAAELIFHPAPWSETQAWRYFCERTARMYATMASRSAGFKLARCDMLSTIAGQSSVS